MPNFVPLTPSGQQLAGSQYPGQRPALAISQFSGQVPLIGTGGFLEPSLPEPQPRTKRDPRKCRHEDKCNGWRIKSSELGLCVGHERAHQNVKGSDGPTGDEGLRPSPS